MPLGFRSLVKSLTNVGDDFVSLEYYSNSRTHRSYAYNLSRLKCKLVPLPGFLCC